MSGAASNGSQLRQQPDLAHRRQWKSRVWVEKPAQAQDAAMGRSPEWAPP